MKKVPGPAGSAVYMVSLGCSKNLVDTEVIAGTLLTSGRTLAFDPNEADLYVINTCAFIPAARREAEEAIEEALVWKKERPGRTVVVAGCLTEWDKPGDYRRRYAEVDLWTGVNDVAGIAALLDEKRVPESGREPLWLYDHTTPRLQLTVPHMAYLKIADGCNNRCSYCAIPGIRGVLRSRSIASVETEAKNLVGAGVKELLVIAQDITAFGADRPGDGEDIARLLERLNAIPGDFVIRLLYTHPAHYTDSFIGFLARPGTKVLPYLDIPLQHINDRILKAMGRPCDEGGDGCAAGETAGGGEGSDHPHHLHHRFPGGDGRGVRGARRFRERTEVRTLRGVSVLARAGDAGGEAAGADSA